MHTTTRLACSTTPSPMDQHGRWYRRATVCTYQHRPSMEGLPSLTRLGQTPKFDDFGYVDEIVVVEFTSNLSLHFLSRGFIRIDLLLKYVFFVADDHRPDTGGMDKLLARHPNLLYACSTRMERRERSSIIIIRRTFVAAQYIAHLELELLQIAGDQCLFTPHHGRESLCMLYIQQHHVHHLSNNLHQDRDAARHHEPRGAERFDLARSRGRSTIP
ncbi:hypothetical protein AB1N83_002501 [Pleurotus pulmonarius]